MREFQDKKKIRKILYSKVVVGVLAVAVLFMAHAVWGVYQKEKASQANAIDSARELARLQDRQQLLNSEINRLSTDQGVEDEIRTQYGVAKPGEHVLILVDKAPTTTAATSTDQGWWQKFKSWFK